MKACSHPAALVAAATVAAPRGRLCGRCLDVCLDVSNSAIVGRRRATTTSTSIHPAREDATPPPQQRRRQRHSFHAADMDSIPSFRDFQRKQQVLHMYRDFVRVAYYYSHHQTNTDRSELVAQIRREFRAVQCNDDPHDVQRNITIGQRRLTELRDMAAKSATLSSSSSSPPSPAASEWPWQRLSSPSQRKPLAFPRKATT